MYMGTEKKAIVIKNVDNSIFEVAYFILKDNMSNVKESQMVREANKILKNHFVGGYFFAEQQKKQRANKGRGYFWLGAMLSAVVCFIFFMIIK